MYIIFDLEMTMWKCRIKKDDDGIYIWQDNEKLYLKHRNQEIIEIGAVKLDDSLNIVDVFGTLVKPLNPITKDCMNITNINEEMLQYADTLEKGLTDWVNWIGNDCNNIFSWGYHDKAHLFREVTRRELFDLRDKLDEIFAGYCDIQQKIVLQYNKNMEIDDKNMYSLKNATALFQMNDCEPFHRAVGDAINVAKLWQAFNSKFEDLAFD